MYNTLRDGGSCDVYYDGYIMMYAIKKNTEYNLKGLSNSGVQRLEITHQYLEQPQHTKVIWASRLSFPTGLWLR